MELQATDFTGDMEDLTEAVESFDVAPIGARATGATSFTEADAKNVQTSLILSSISIALWVVSAIFVVMKKFGVL